MLPLICTVESVPVVRVKTSTVDSVPVFITCCYSCCGGVLKWVRCTVACCGGADKDDCGVGLRLPATIPGPPDGRVVQSLDRAVVQSLDRAVRFDNHVSTTCSIGSSGSRRRFSRPIYTAR